MKKERYFRVMLVMLFFSVVFAELVAQSLGDLRLEKAALKERLKYLEKEMEVEKKELEIFRNKKQKLLDQKKREKKLVLKEVSTREGEIARAKNEMAAVRRKKKRIYEENKEIIHFLSQKVEEWIKEIPDGIPFEKENRKAVLSRLFYDMTGARIGVSEAYSRFISFFDKEIDMGYDSQVVRAIVDVNGKKVTGSLLRLGRVYFAFDAGDDIYRFVKKPDGKGYVLAEKSLSLAEQSAMRNIIDMIEGRTPPDLIVVDVPVSKAD